MQKGRHDRRQRHAHTRCRPLDPTCEVAAKGGPLLLPGARRGALGGRQPRASPVNEQAEQAQQAERLGQQRLQHQVGGEAGRRRRCVCVGGRRGQVGGEGGRTRAGWAREQGSSGSHAAPAEAQLPAGSAAWATHKMAVCGAAVPSTVRMEPGLFTSCRICQQGERDGRAGEPHQSELNAPTQVVTPTTFKPYSHLVANTSHTPP